MSTGKYFLIDQSSEKDNDNLRFRYTGLSLVNYHINCSQNCENIELKQIGNHPGFCPQFPIYVTIEEDEVNFYFHGFVKKDIAEKDRTKFSYIMVNRPILTLPLSANLDVKDGLTSKLKEAYNAIFPYASELYQNNRVAKDNLQYEYRSYSNLFQIYNEKLLTDHVLVLRQLLLDFIFDWEHSRVFQHSHLYEEVEIRLKENYHFFSLCAKYAFWYEKMRFYVFTEDKEQKEHYAQLMFTALEQWLMVIRNPKSAHLFSSSPWFINTLEQEYKNALFYTYPKESIPDEQKEMSWTSLTVRAISVLSNDVQKCTLCLVNDAISIIKDSNLQNKEEKEKHNIRVGSFKTTSINWFVKRYNLFSPLRLISNRSLRVLISILVVLLSFNTLIMVLPLKLNISFFLYNPIILFVALSVFAMAAKTLNVILPRYIIAILSAWLLVYSTGDFWSIGLNIKQVNHIQLTIYLILSLVAIAFLYNELSNIDGYLKLSVRITRAGLIFLFGLLISANLGLYINMFSTRQILLYDNENISHILGLYPSSKEKLDSITTEKKNNRKYNTINQVKDTVTNDSISGINIKLNFINDSLQMTNKVQGIAIKHSNDVATEYLTNSDFLKTLLIIKRTNLKFQIINQEDKSFNQQCLVQSFNDCEYYCIHKPTYILFIFLTVFFGLFFQLIFEDKAVTESF